MSASSPPASGAASRRIWAAASTLAALLLVYFSAEWFRATWRAVAAGAERPRIDLGWSAVGIALLVAHAATSVRLWRQVVQATGAAFTPRAALDSFVPSLLARYVPGKVWANGARLFLARRAGVPLVGGTGALLWEMGVVFGTGGLVAAAVLAIAGARTPLLAAALLTAASVVGFAALSALAATARRTDGRLAAWLHAAQAVRSPRALGPAAGTALLGWVAYGAAHVAFLRALQPVTLHEGALAAGAVVLAWAGGVLAVIAPAGLGVRDGLLYAMLGALLDPARALVYVALTRLAQFAVDALLTAVWFIARLGARRPAPGA